MAVVGWGEGGMLALYSAALDPRIDVTCVSGYFEPREGIWQTPIDRNVFGLLEQFGDAELATLVAPRTLIIEAAQGSSVTLPPGQGGAPARVGHTRARAGAAGSGARQEPGAGLTDRPGCTGRLRGRHRTVPDQVDPAGRHAALKPDLADRRRGCSAARTWRCRERRSGPSATPGAGDRRLQPVAVARKPYVRQEFMSKVDTSTLAAYQASLGRIARCFARR